MLGWHFVGETLRDGRPVPADGEKLRHEGKLILCESGLHASERVLDALQYAPGATLCRVECGGKIIHDYDKFVCQERTVLWRKDVTEVLKEFARWVALDVIHFWNPPEVVVEFLKTGDNKIRDAARAAARNAAWDAARNAAWAAAWDAARDAARAAARNAARAAARNAAWDAARNAAWDRYNEKITLMIQNA